VSVKFYAVNRHTNERLLLPKGSYLVLYDSGYGAVVTQDFYTSIRPLSSEYKIVFKNNFGKEKES